MITLNEEVVIKISGQPYFHVGYAYGFKSSCLTYRVTISEKQCSHTSYINEFLQKKAEQISDKKIDNKNLTPINLLKTWVGPILKLAKHPIFELSRELLDASTAKNNSTIIQPCFHAKATIQAINFVINLINANVNNLANKNLLFSDWDQELTKLINQLSKTALDGFNSNFFIYAAYELDIPWIYLSENLIQLGTGKRSRWIQSSFTDKTPVISSKLARNKSLTAKLLEKAGLPVPKHFFALSADDAVKHAESLGYPIVVKPANLDGGVAVQANINDPTAVRKAFEKAKNVSDQVLVEKHVPGNDYRLQIVNCKVHGILERVPGGVIGNGKSNIFELMTEQNNIRKNALDDRRYLHQIIKDEESTAQLKIQGLNWEFVPHASRFVRLRGAANVASGGTPIPIIVEEAHPDNIAMAVRAARILKLDIAGVDLLIPDIRRSWLETGAYICEVNAMPQMFNTMHKPMLQSIFSDGRSRIPVIIHLIKDLAENYIGRQIHSQLNQLGITSGFVHDDKAWVGYDCIKQGIEDAFFGARMLVYDQNVEAMVISSNGNSFHKHGWPTDRFDVLIIESLPNTLDVSQTSKLILDWTITASKLEAALVIAPQHMETEITKLLSHLKLKLQLITCNFSNHKQIDQLVIKVISMLDLENH